LKGERENGKKEGKHVHNYKKGKTLKERCGIGTQKSIIQRNGRKARRVEPTGSLGIGRFLDGLASAQKTK
jgi:hypothetical protein